MFGGFPPSFFEAYHRLVPISEPVSEYEIRGKLYECWHRLNHTLLFGVRLVSFESFNLDVILKVKLASDEL